MDKNLLVQVIVAEEGDRVRCGTAYPVAPNRLITAAHVIENALPQQIEFSWYHQTPVNRGWRPCTEIIWDGRKAGFDVMVLACEFPDSIKNQYRLLADVNPRTDSKWESEGFPLVGRRGDQWRSIGMKGAVFSMSDQSRLMELEVDAPPSSEQGWQGASGSPVFVDGAIIGIVVSCPSDFRAGRLQAVPACRLLEQRDSDFKEAVALTEDEKRALLIREAVDLLAQSPDALKTLSEQVDIPDLDDHQKWARQILAKLLQSKTPPQVLAAVLRAQHKLDRQSRSEAANLVERVAYYVLPAALTDAHVKQMQVIADTGSQQFQFQAKTRTFVEVAMARISGRDTKFRSVKAHRDYPRGQFCIVKPPESGMDDGHEKFINNFIDALGESMIGSDLRDEDKSETVRAINADLSARLDSGQQFYYVFDNPKDEAARRRRHALAAALDEKFPSIAFIALDPHASQEELDTLPRIMQILCRAAGIEENPYGTT